MVVIDNYAPSCSPRAGAWLDGRERFAFSATMRSTLMAFADASSRSRALARAGSTRRRGRHGGAIREPLVGADTRRLSRASSDGDRNSEGASWRAENCVSKSSAIEHTARICSKV